MLADRSASFLNVSEEGEALLTLSSFMTGVDWQSETTYDPWIATDLITHTLILEVSFHSRSYHVTTHLLQPLERCVDILPNN